MLYHTFSEEKYNKFQIKGGHDKIALNILEMGCFQIISANS